MTTKDDLKQLRAWILGVVAFATAVSTFLVTVFHCDVGITAGVAALVAVIFVVIVLLIDRAENRMRIELEKHKAESEQNSVDVASRFDKIDKTLLEIQRSALRTEMNGIIYRNPENHDTILRMAYRYFIELDADWVETDLFEQWRDSENKAGRPVKLSVELMANISQKIDAERVIK